MQQPGNFCIIQEGYSVEEEYSVESRERSSIKAEECSSECECSPKAECSVKAVNSVKEEHGGADHKVSVFVLDMGFARKFCSSTPYSNDDWDDFVGTPGKAVLHPASKSHAAGTATRDHCLT